MDGFIDFGGIDEICCAEFLGPGFFAVVSIYCDDSLCAIGDAALNDAETDTTGAKDGARGPLFDFGGPCGSAETGSDTTAEETSPVERSFWVDCNNGDVRNNWALEWKRERKLPVYWENVDVPM